MPKLPRDVSGEQALRAFMRAGYIHDHTVGGHAVLLQAADPRRRLVVPLHRAIKAGTLSKLIKDAGLTVDEFIELL